MPEKLYVKLDATDFVKHIHEALDQVKSEINAEHRKWSTLMKAKSRSRYIDDKSEFVDSLIDTLGLDPAGLRGFTLHCQVDQPVIVECERYAKVGEEEIIKEKFKLVKI
jgi:hypothetical protein